ACVFFRRGIAAPRAGAALAGSEMHPRAPDLHALLALALLRALHALDPLNVRARFVRIQRAPLQAAHHLKTCDPPRAEVGVEHVDAPNVQQRAAASRKLSRV